MSRSPVFAPSSLDRSRSSSGRRRAQLRRVPTQSAGRRPKRSRVRFQTLAGLDQPPWRGRSMICGHGDVPARAVWSAPEGHSTRAAHSTTGSCPTPQDIVGSSLPRDPFEVGSDTQATDLALGEHQPPIEHDGFDGSPGEPPIRHRVAVGISSAHQRVGAGPDEAFCSSKAAAIRWIWPG